MAGVWVFKKGVMRLVEKPGNKEQVSSSSSSSSAAGRRKVLLHTPSAEVIACYASLERKLAALGWEKYYEDPELLQFHRRSSIDLISLPRDFARFNSIHMYDIVVKNRDAFKVVENH